MNDPLANLLKEELGKGLPGEKGQGLMAPASRRGYKVPISQETKVGAVLIPIFKKKGIYHVVLFQRPEYDGQHGGQICFPGGKVEQFDKTMAHTALRETWEEIGIPSENIELIGELTPLHIPVSNFLVHPFLGFVNGDPEFQPDALEVQKIIVTPVSVLFNIKNQMIGEMEHDGKTFTIPYFDIAGHVVWGATAMIISEWLEIMKRPSFLHINWNSGDSAQ
jgi:8-oxo-dGTP pyrophosphatase MutT (NUDIX family)